MFKIFIVLLSVFSSVLFAQKPVIIKWDKSIGSGKIIEIQSYFKGQVKLLTSISTDNRDSVVINDLKSAGLYMIGLKGFKNNAEFIYNPQEEMLIDVGMDLSNGQLAIERSKENICYNDLMIINKAYNYFLDSLQMARKNVHLTTVDYYGRCFYLDSLYEAVAAEKNGRLTYLQFTYPNTYTSEILVPLSLVPISSINERGKFQTPYAYLSKFNFKYVSPDARQLYHYGLEDAVINYLAKYSSQSESGIKSSIDYVTETFSKDTSVSNFISALLIKTFLEAKSPELALYVMGQSGEGCTFDLGEKQAEYLSNYSHIQIGKQVDDIILNDINAQPNSLSNTCKKGEFTILLFWISWCKHCGTFLPELQKIASSYKTKLNIFAVSLDESETEWKKFVADNKLESWVHVSELKKIEKSTLAPRFMVTQTPTMFLLDKSRNILAKNLTKDQLLVELQNRIK